MAYNVFSGTLNLTQSSKCAQYHEVPVFEADEGGEERRQRPDDFPLHGVFDVGLDERQSQFGCDDEHRVPHQQRLRRRVVFEQLHHRRAGFGGCWLLHNTISGLLGSVLESHCYPFYPGSVAVRNKHLLHDALLPNYCLSIRSHLPERTSVFTAR